MTTRTCKFPGCPRLHYGRGYCQSHLQQTTYHRKLTPFSDAVPVEFRGPREQGPWTGSLREVMAGAPRWSGKHGSHT